MIDPKPAAFVPVFSVYTAVNVAVCITAAPETLVMPQFSTPTSPPALFRGRWLAFVAVVLVALNLRTAVTSVTPLLERLGQVFGFGNTLAGVLGMVPVIAFALSGLATPRLIGRIGLQHTAMVCMALATLGLIVRALAPNTGVLLLGSSVALIGMGIGNVVVPPLVKRYFPDRVGAFSTLYITVLQIGTMAPALLSVPAADRYGWRVSLGMWALLSLCAMLPWWLLAKQEKPAHALSSTSAVPVHADGKVWKTSLGWGMALMFGMTSLGSYSMFTWLPKIMLDAGASEAFGGAMVAWYSAISLLPSLLVPVLAARLRNPFMIAVAAFVLSLSAYLGLLLAPMQLPWLWVCLAGLGPSTFPMALVLINLRTRTQTGSAVLSGFMQGVGYSIAGVGPLLFGWLRGNTGTWLASFSVLMSALFVLLVAAWFACKPQQLEDHW